MGKAAKSVKTSWLAVRRAFRLGILATLLVVAAAFAYERLTVDDGLRYLYVIRLDPASGGPSLVSLEMPVLEEGFWKITTIDGTVILFGGGTLFIVRSAERKDQDEIRRLLDKPDLSTQSADAGGGGGEPSA